MSDFEFHPAAFIVGLVRFIPALLMLYFGGKYPHKFVPGINRLTVWIVILVIALDLLRQSVWWIARSFGYDISYMTHAPEGTLALMSALLLGLAFWADEALVRNERDG